jgi:hypothetical protein
MTEGNLAACEIHQAFRELEGRHDPPENNLRRKLWARLEYVREQQEAGVLVRPLSTVPDGAVDVVTRWEGYLSQASLTTGAVVRTLADATVGERFGRWTTIENLDGIPRAVRCQCDCGTIKVVRLSHLRSGDSRSCGCTRRLAAEPEEQVDAIKEAARETLAALPADATVRDAADALAHTIAPLLPPEPSSTK